MADRAGTPLVLLFMRFNEDEGAATTPTDADEHAVEAADVLISAIRDADLPARIAEDTFCVLLAGDARGAEVTVLSRLVEAIAVHDAKTTHTRPISLSIGSAIYDPADPVALEDLLDAAEGGMRPHSSESR